LNTFTANLVDERIFPATNSNPDWLVPFMPPRWLRGGHVQTLAGNYWPRQPLAIVSEREVVVVDARDNSRVLCECHWQPEPVRAGRLTVILVHGLEGSSDSQYIRGITALAWNAGCNVIRMNMRNCGGTDTWSPTLYHSGLSEDVWAVLQHFAGAYDLERVAMVGYSMGGNLVLKLAGELAAEAPMWLRGAVGVSPAVDLAASADALNEPSNRMYERHFLGNLMRRFRRKAELFPDLFTMDGLGPIRTIREFDDRITARYSGFMSADDYYYRAAAARVVSQIAVPTMVLHAMDDPFIRLTPESGAALHANPAVTLIETEYGGHCAFLQKKGPASTLEANPVPHDGRHWAEATLVRFLIARAGHAVGS
jgi:hypothetical protein